MRMSLPLRSAPVTAALLTVLALGACAEKPADAGSTPAATPAGAPGKVNGPAVAPEQPARIVGGANSQSTGSSQPSGTSQPVMAGAATGQMPAGHPPIGAGQAGAAPAGAAGPGGRVAGTITLDPARAADVKAGAALYIIVRRDAGEGQKGMLIASKRVDVTGPGMFPLTYDVGPENVMMGGNSLDGQVRVEARVDQDGDAISKSPGDVVGAKAGAVTVGAPGAVDFVLAEKL
jgi:hypothetical protein